MPPRHLLALLAISALVASAAAADNLPPSPAAVALARAPRILSASTTPSSIGSGIVTLRVASENVDRISVTTSCPRNTYVKLGNGNLCGSTRSRTEDQLERQMLRVRNPYHSTGTIAITVTVVEPEVAVSSSTQKTVKLKLLGS